ncbi:MAG: DUF3124 domain-containing protein [Betaproteobacteria bacterium]|nr:MAG: DUF3124 domain-containing protein [Betaproteobacteria bacterium]
MRANWVTFMALSLLCFCGSAVAQVSTTKSSGQTLYLPIYSHIWHGDFDRTGEPAKTLVSISVSIRNTDPANAIRVSSAQYYDTNGRKLKEYVPSPRAIAPMATYELFIQRSDDSGGSGANFLISWSSEAPVNPPIVEGVHANLPAGRSIVFTTSARPLAP